jgi:flagellar protein FlaG
MNIKGVNLNQVDKPDRYVKNPEVAAQTMLVQPPQKEPSRDLSREEMNSLVDKLNSGVRDIHERVSFSFHERTQRVVLKIINSETDEVIREIPPKEAIKLLEHIQDFLGMLVDESR